VRRLTIIVVSLVLTSTTAEAKPHFLWHKKGLSQERKVAYFERSVKRDRWAVSFLTGRPSKVARSDLRWYRAALKWHQELYARYKAKLVPKIDYWVAKQIRVAEMIGRSARKDPWPNCPDPYDGSGSWSDTVNCENGGNWYDSAGYYRCGLQFDPMWEIRYGPLCP